MGHKGINFCHLQGSITPTLYKQLLHAEIPKAQKDTDDYVLLGCMRVKAACKHVGEIDPKCLQKFKKKIGANIVHKLR